MKLISLILIIYITSMSTGCAHATYKYKSCTAVNVCTELNIVSRRNFEKGIHVEHKDTVIKAGKVEGAESPLEQALSDILTNILKNIDYSTILTGGSK